MNLAEEFSKDIQSNYFNFMEVEPDKPDQITQYNVLGTIGRFDNKANTHYENNVGFRWLAN